jgi:hypothetical protein
MTPLVLSLMLAAAPPAEFDPCSPERMGPCNVAIRTHAVNARTFEIPFVATTSQPIKAVRLHVSTDGNKTFRHVATAAPKHGSFVYNADRDGWHYFVVQREDSDGALTPSTVDASGIDLAVLVDQRPPVVSLKGPATQCLGPIQSVSWTASDDYALDLSRLKLEYRPVGAHFWTGLAIRPAARGKFDWTASESAGEFEVRLTAYDRAGNAAQATTKVRTIQFRPQPRPLPEPPPLPGFVAPVRPSLSFVKKKTFAVRYKLDDVGPSGVKAVEVWMTHEGGPWAKLGDAPADPKGGHEVTVTAAGHYGFWMRPISGVGRARNEPHPHDRPQLLVMVDETPPTVEILGVRVGEGEEQGTITVNYRTFDAWLRPESIRISYAASKDGPWSVLKENLPNTWAATLPLADVKGHELYLRVEASDLAGNVGCAITPEPITTDLHEPTVTGLEVVPEKEGKEARNTGSESLPIAPPPASAAPAPPVARPVSPPLPPPAVEPPPPPP